MAAQHRVLVLDWETNGSKKRIQEQVTPNSKWWRLKDNRENVLSEIKKTAGECSGMVGGEQHGGIESWTGCAWYDNREQTQGQGYMVVER